jgi:hypothetical protein
MRLTRSLAFEDINHCLRPHNLEAIDGMRTSVMIYPEPESFGRTLYPNDHMAGSLHSLSEALTPCPFLPVNTRCIYCRIKEPRRDEGNVTFCPVSDPDTYPKTKDCRFRRNWTYRGSRGR